MCSLPFLEELTVVLPGNKYQKAYSSLDFPIFIAFVFDMLEYLWTGLLFFLPSPMLKLRAEAGTIFYNFLGEGVAISVEII